MKKKLLIAYFVIGCVWTIIQLPNLLQKTNSNPIKATLLAVFRILAWPVLSSMDLFDKIKQIRLEKQAHDNNDIVNAGTEDTEENEDTHTDEADNDGK